MNFADIETAWRSPHNRPSPAELEHQKMKFAADLRRRRRGFVLFIAFVFTTLTLVTARVAVHLLRPDPALDRIDLSREWAFLLVLALPWAAALRFTWQYRRHRVAHGHGDRSIADSVRALLDENRLSRTRVKVAACLHAAFLVLIPLVVHQLRATGKAGDEILVPAFVVWPLIAGGILLAMARHYRRTLLPQKRELETLLGSYE